MIHDGRRTGARRWPVIASTVVATAVVQALLVVTDPEPLPAPLFIVLSLASFVALVAAIAMVAAAASGRVRPGARLVLWSTVVVLAVVLLSFVSPLTVPLTIAAALVVIPAAAANVPNPFDGFAVFRTGPFRSTIAVLVAIVVLLVDWLVSLLLGFFVTGPVSAGLTWLWFGATGAVLLCWFDARYRRSTQRTPSERERPAATREHTAPDSDEPAASAPSARE